MKNHNSSSAFVTYTLVGILSAVISFVTMIILTRTATETFFGQINKFLTASNLVMSLACLGLDSAYIRFYYEPPENANSKQLAWKCMRPALFIFLLVSSFIIFFRNNSSLILLLGGGGLFFTTAFIFTIFSQFLNRFLSIYFRMNSKVLNFSIVTIAFAVLTKTIFIPIYYITPKFEENIITAALFLTIFMFGYFLFNMKNMVEISSSSLADYRPVYRFAILSSPVFVITYLNSYLPQVIISSYLGDNVLGIYSAALLFCSAILVLSTGFSTFWSPYMYKNYKTAQDFIRKVHDVVLFASVLAMSLILFFSDFIYLFIGETFRKNQNILGMLLVYPIILIMVETVAYGISIKKKNEISLIIYFISTTTNVILCFILVSTYGLAGVAFASMISAIVQMILMTYFGQKYYRSINSIIKTLFHMLVLILSAILFYLFYDNRTIFVAAEVAMLIICVIYNRNVISWGFNLLKTRSNNWQ